MNHLTDRNAERPGDDPIFALNREATQRRAKGESVINATVGALLDDDGALALMPSVQDAITNVPARVGAAYAPIAGAPDFLRGVITDLFGESVLAKRATACATPGGSGALRHALSLFLDRGQSVLTTSFYWGPYATLADEQERAVRTFAMFNADGGLDVNAFATALDETLAKQGRALVFLNDPCHNPTGYSMEASEWDAVADTVLAANKRGPVTVLIDLAYMAFAEGAPAWTQAVTRLTEQTLVLFAWTASKSFAQYGARVGALVACTADDTERAAITNAFAYASRGSWSNCNALGQAAVARCLNDGETRARVESERARLRTLLAARVKAFNEAAQGSTLRYPKYRGGFFVTVFCDDVARASEKLKSRGVFTVPQKGALRVALCGVAVKDVPLLVKSLEESV